MQIDLIHTFLDLCDSQSFNRTADRLGVTQSTISGRIASLERSLGARLFRRSRAGTALTAAGRRFEPYARTLRQTWAEARQNVAGREDPALTLRLGVQHDLAEERIGGWLGVIRAALPEAAVYVEADYSEQMCRDVEAGDLDLAVLYTPKPRPDLHFETLGEVTYLMVSSQTDQLAAVRIETYILPAYSPAFARTHAELLPALAAAPISSGQTGVVAGIFATEGGATYLPAETARALVAGGRAHLVRRAPPIRQPVYAALHLRNRHRPQHRRIVRLIRDALGHDGGFRGHGTAGGRTGHL